jgi:hypothetical protein
VRLLRVEPIGTLFATCAIRKEVVTFVWTSCLISSKSINLLSDKFLIFWLCIFFYGWDYCMYREVFQLELMETEKMNYSIM